MSLFITHNGETVEPDMFVLLYMPIERKEAVEAFLEEHNLARKFVVIEGNLSTSITDDDGTHITDHPTIKTLVLMMRDKKVLFEYKLSGKHHELLTRITEYVNGRKEES